MSHEYVGRVRPLPTPILARSGPLPIGRGCAFEIKWDGFRALVCTRDGLRVRSRRRWDMTPLLPELEALPAGLLLDGELVAWGDDGLPSFPLLGEGMLFRAYGVAVTYLIFDVLAVDGGSTMHLPYRKRRQLLDELNLSEPAWHTPPAWDDGEPLWNVVCERGLEGVVVKRLAEPYRPGERLWTKVKNRDYWRYPLEVESFQRELARERRALSLTRRSAR